MAYVKSDKIAVFPSANRIAAYPDAKLTTEYNLTNIINRLIDVKSFVINSNYISNASTSTPLEFNIRGYYFKVENAAIESILNTVGDDTELYAVIALTDVTSGGYHFRELKNMESEGGSTLDIQTGSDYYFQGVQFVTSIDSSNPPDSYLKILEKVGNAWQVPASSKIRFTTGLDGTRSLSIDDGELS